MGAACARRSGEEPSTNNVKHSIPVISKSKKTQLSDKSGSSKNIHSSEEILDDNFKAQINGIMKEYVASVTTTYLTERERIVNEMSRSAPEPYLGLLFSEYPDVNGSTVNQMARRLATSDETRQRLTDQVNDRIESSFTSRTTDWNSTSRQTARSDVKNLLKIL